MQQIQTKDFATERLWDEKEAAVFLRYTKRGLEELRKAGRVPHLIIGRCIRYRPESLRAFLAKLERGGN